MRLIKLMAWGLLFIISACTGPDLEPLDFFEVRTIQPRSEQDLGRVILGGDIEGLGSTTLDDYGFIWSTSLTLLVENPEAAQRHSLGTASGITIFSWTTPALSIDSLYYFKAYALKGERMMYGQAAAFIWGVKMNINQISRNNEVVTLNGSISGLEDRQTRVTDYGVLYSSVNPEPEYGQDGVVSKGPSNSDGPFEAQIGPLNFNTTYYFRLFLKSGAGVVYPDDSISVFRVTDGWQLLGYLNGPLTRAATASGGNKAYIGWGCEVKIGNCPSGNGFGSFLQITDPTSNWAEFPAPDNSLSENFARVGANAFIINNQCFTGFGSYFRDQSLSTHYPADLWWFNENTQQWKDANDGFPQSGRADAATFVIGDKAYLGTGHFNNNPFSDFYEFDPARPDFDKWVPMESIPQSRSGAAAFSIAGKGYVVGGLSGVQTLKDAWEFTPPSGNDPDGSWTPLPDFEGSSRYGAVAFVIGNKAYIGLGESFNGELADFWEFDPAHPSDPWKSLTSFPGKPRGRSAGFSINNRGYVAGGDGRDLGPNAFIPRTDSDVWVYIPEQN